MLRIVYKCLNCHMHCKDISLFSLREQFRINVICSGASVYFFPVIPDDFIHLVEKNHRASSSRCSMKQGNLQI
jgi:hypothetical protein